MKKFVIDINSIIDSLHGYLSGIKLKNLFIPLLLSGLVSGILLGIVAFTERVVAYGGGLAIVNKLQVLASSIGLLSVFGVLINVAIFLSVVSSIYFFLGFTKLTKEKGKVSPYKVLILYSIIASATCTFVFINYFIQAPENIISEFFLKLYVLKIVLYILCPLILLLIGFSIILIKRKSLFNKLEGSRKPLIAFSIITLAVLVLLIVTYKDIVADYSLIFFYYAKETSLSINNLWPKVISLYVNNLYVFDACLFIILSVVFIIVSYLSVFIIKKIIDFRYSLAIIGLILFALTVYLYLLSQNMFTNQLLFHFIMSIILISISSLVFVFSSFIVLIVYHYFKEPVNSFVSAKIKYQYIVIFYVIIAIIAFWGLKTSNATKAFIFRHCTYQKIVLDWPKIIDLNKNVIVYQPCKKILAGNNNVNHLKQNLKRKPNIFFITIDTLGSKITNDYIRNNKNSALNKFAKQSYNFTNAYSPSTYTYASFSSTFASKYLAHMADIDLPTLPQILALNGYKTLSLMALNPFNEKGTVTLNPKNYPYTFDTNDNNEDSFITVNLKEYKNFLDMYLVTLEDKCYPSLLSKGYNESERPPIKFYHIEKDGIITSKFISYLKNHNHDEPLFVWMHYSQLHMIPSTIVFNCLLGNEAFKKAYDYNLGIVDINLKKDFEALKQYNMFDNSIIIVSSDHGESAKEHGDFFHIYSTYNEYNYIPLIIKLPGEEEGKTIKTPASLIDVTPTILDYLGYDYKNLDFCGQSLLKVIKSPEKNKQPVYSILYMYKSPKNFSYNLTGFDNCYDKTILEVAIIDENNEWKLIDNKYFNFRELYNLQNDPYERNNLIDQNPEKARQLLSKIHNSLFLKK